MRIFLDTNLLISAFATRGVCADLLRSVLAEHTLVISEVVLDELTRALRTRIKMPPPLVEEIVGFLREQEVVPCPAEPSPVFIRDPADQWILASAVDAGADLLVTGDQDPLEIAAESPVKIVTPRAFWELSRRR